MELAGFHGFFSGKEEGKTENLKQPALDPFAIASKACIMVSV
jgi:hypothetical protein